MDGASDAWYRRSWLVPFLLLCMRDRYLYGQETPGGEGLTFSGREKMEYLLSRRRYALTDGGEACLEFLASEIQRFFPAYQGRPVQEVYG